jgi:hypothetical protein
MRAQKTIVTVVFLIAFFPALYSQPTAALPFRVSALTEGGLRLDTLWKMFAGDQPDFAAADFDDSKWKTSVTHPIQADCRSCSGIFWFRLRLAVDSALRNKAIAIVCEQFGASEIFLNGKLVGSFGTVSADPEKEKRFNPNKLPFCFQLNSLDTQLIAVRFSNHAGWENVKASGEPMNGFFLILTDVNTSLLAYKQTMEGSSGYLTLLCGLFLTLGFVHLFLFLFNRAKRSNLFYSVFAFCLGSLFGYLVIMSTGNNPDTGNDFAFFSGIIWSVIPVSLLALLYNLFYERYPLLFKILAAAYALVALSVIFHVKAGIYLSVVCSLVTCVEFIRITIWSLWKKKEGAWIIGGGLIGFVFLFVGLFFYVLVAYKGFQSVPWNETEGEIISGLYLAGVLAIPISMSLYLARDFALTSKKLGRKLEEVESLSARSIEQEKEKQKILETQKENLELQVAERTREISEQKHLIEEKNKEMIDSINYASRIQRALLATDVYISRNLGKLRKKS